MLFYKPSFAAVKQAIDKISSWKIQEFYSRFVSFRISFLVFSHPRWHSRKRECWENVELPGNMALWGLSTLIADFMPLSRPLVSYVYMHKASSPFFHPPYVIFFIPRKRMPEYGLWIVSLRKKLRTKWTSKWPTDMHQRHSLYRINARRVSVKWLCI